MIKQYYKILLTTCLCMIIFTSHGLSEIIKKIEISGNQRIPDETIKMLKKIIHKQHLRLSKSSKDYDSDNDESDSGSEYETDTESEYSDDETDIIQKKKMFYNHNLKSALKKYNQKIPDKKIDDLFVKMEITPKTKITKPVLVAMIKYFK